MRITSCACNFLLVPKRTGAKTTASAFGDILLLSECLVTLQNNLMISAIAARNENIYKHGCHIMPEMTGNGRK